MLLNAPAGSELPGRTASSSTTAVSRAVLGGLMAGTLTMLAVSTLLSCLYCRQQRRTDLNWVHTGWRSC